MGEPSTLDPYDDDASELTYALVRPVFPMPFRMTTEGTPEPDLARSLTPTPSGARLVLERREWSDGRAVTARDVAASIRRATPPSGFARIDEARAISRRVIELIGDVADWPSILATGAFVLPNGRLSGGNVSAGPFRFAAYERGRRLVYEANEGATEDPLLDRIEVSFVQGTELLIRLLENGDVDAAWLPSSVNLGERLVEKGIQYGSAQGNERLIIRFHPERVRRSSALALVRAMDLESIQEAFLRDDGEVVAIDVPGGRLPPSVSVAAPEGDELLALIQRAVQLQLERSEVVVELLGAPVSSLYGPWQDEAPADLLLQRSLAPGPRSIVVAKLSTFLAWRDEVHGMVVNPSLDGPMWNAGQWWIQPSI